MPLEPLRPATRWTFLGLGAVAAAWVVALAFAVYFRSVDARAPEAVPADVERKRAEIHAELVRRAALRALEAQAEHGDVAAMIKAGRAYAKGTNGANRDPKKAFVWHLRAAKANSLAGMISVASDYDRGSGTPKDRHEAANWYERAAARGNAGAAQLLGDLYARGIDGTPDHALALKWFQVAADGGNALARRRIGEASEQGLGVPRDETAAFYVYSRLAEAGDAWAQNKIGTMLVAGRGVPVDLAQAVRWFTAAADQDFPPGIGNLAQAYLFGWGMERDVEKGRDLLQKAREAGDADATAELALFRLNGAFGFSPNPKEGVALLQSAAAQKNEKAQVALAVLQLQGVLVPLDVKGAVAELSRLADQGTAAAQSALAQVYLKGLPGVAADWPKARRLLEQAAAEGFAPAISLHAALLRHGIGGPRDGAKAVAELKSAAQQNDAFALVFLASITATGDKDAGVPPDREAALRLLDQASAANDPVIANVRKAMLDETGELASKALVIPEKPAPAEADSTVGSRTPVPLVRVRPRYPVELRLLDITGTVLVEFVVTSDGQVANAAAIKSSLAGFEAPAIAAVNQWRFQPGIKDGHPVNTRMQVPIVFSLRDEDTSSSER